MYLWVGAAVALIALTLGGVDAELPVDYCGLTCPQVGEIIKGEIARKQAANPAAAAGFLRIFFHDCSVDRCDASVMITSTTEHKAERDADVNLPLSGGRFDAVTRSMTAVEAKCVGIVSCADKTRDVPALTVVSANCTSGIIDHSGHATMSVFNVGKYGAVGDEKHDSTQAIIRAWYATCGKPSTMLLVPANKKFVLYNLLCQPGFIFKVDGMTGAVQNPQKRKNTITRLQFAKVESFILIDGGLIDGHGENLWAGQYTRFNEQTSIAAMDKIVKGRTLLERTKPTKPKTDPGSPAQHY